MTSEVRQINGRLRREKSQLPRNSENGRDGRASREKYKRIHILKSVEIREITERFAERVHILKAVESSNVVVPNKNKVYLLCILASLAECFQDLERAQKNASKFQKSTKSRIAKILGLSLKNDLKFARILPFSLEWYHN